jgi:hypothetical protein
MQAYKNIARVGLVAAAVVLVAATGVLAQGVAPPLGGSATTYPLTTNGWDILDPSGTPQVVVRDPLGQPWYKDLATTPGVVVLPGSVFKVHELLTVGGNLSWSDWHEQILTPGWEWLPASNLLANGVPAPGLTVTTTPGTSTLGGSIDYTFGSLAPGTLVDISKAIVYSGTGLPAPTPPFFGSIRVAEFPTPEPATLGLLALGGLAVLRRRRAASL